VSYYLKKQREVLLRIKQMLFQNEVVIVSPIAYYEIKRGLLAVNSKNRLRDFEEFCEKLGVGKLDNNLLDDATLIYVELRNQGRIVEDADIFAAAFCRKSGYILVTHNTKHFVAISGLRVEDWA
jgi:predicted nucleic acid-binding protein